MIYNANVILSLLLGLLLFFLSVRLFKSLDSAWTKITFVTISVVLALVSLIIPLAYLSNRVGENPLYAEFRAYPVVELLVVFVVPLVGIMNAWLVDKRALGLGHILKVVSLVFMLFYLSLPFIKPLIRPLQNNLTNKWQDNIALQTSLATCGPASLATVFKYYGKDDTEANIAQKAFTSSTGTENWYLARYAYSQGFDYQFLSIPDLDKVPTPAIIGVRLSHFGHFIVLLSNQGGIYEVADSLVGRTIFSSSDFYKKYHYSGFVFYIRPSNG